MVNAMNEVQEAYETFRSQNAIDELPIEMQLVLAFGAGVVFGSKKVAAVIETKLTIEKVKK